MSIDGNVDDTHDRYDVDDDVDDHFNQSSHHLCHGRPGKDDGCACSLL